MTAVAQHQDEQVADVGAPTGGHSATAVVRPPQRLGRLVGVWVVVTIVGVWIVIANLGPLTEERDQRALLTTYSEEITSASNQAFGLAGVEVPTTAPTRGDPVGILDLPSIDLRRVVVEGSAPRETRMGPGHVSGTAGPGQPGNSVIVGRRSFYGGAFSSIGDLAEGDRLLVTTTQGQSVYEVVHVGEHEIVSGDVVEEDVALSEDDGTTPTTAFEVVVTDPEELEDGGEVAPAEPVLVLPEGSVTVDEVYGPSADDRLTLVTSASGVPWVSDQAELVVAVMDGVPFAPTPQGGRTEGDDGRSGDAVAMAALVLALVGYAAAVGAAIWLHRHLSGRSAYLLTAPLLLALTIVLAEQLTHVLPAWS